LFFTTHPSFKQRCKPLPSIGNSDHDIVLLDVACKPVKPKPTRRTIYLWKKAEVHNLQKDSSSPLSAMVSKSAWFVCIGYWFVWIDCSDQQMSGRLKSPPIMKIYFLRLILSPLTSSLNSLLSISLTCFGGL
jgi:hypothetical protein